jgi:hypothetical protein
MARSTPEPRGCAQPDTQPHRAAAEIAPGSCQGPVRQTDSVVRPARPTHACVASESSWRRVLSGALPWAIPPPSNLSGDHSRSGKPAPNGNMAEHGAWAWAAPVVGVGIRAAAAGPSSRCNGRASGGWPRNT